MTLFDVPDQPGVSARIPSAVASEGILVDTHKHRPHGLADISFTIRGPQSKQEGGACWINLSNELGGRKRMSQSRDPHCQASASVATRALACECSAASRSRHQRRMVSTSEVRKNVVIDATKQQLDWLHSGSL